MKRARDPKTNLFSQSVGRALRRAAKVARKMARAYNTPDLYLAERQGRRQKTVTLSDIDRHSSFVASVEQTREAEP